MSSAYKAEKKLMDEKVQKVRQVVANVSANDIILALHNYDLDVNRTIQAFHEEGHKGAVGEWENTAKPKKSKKKTAVAVTNGTAQPAPSTTRTPAGTGNKTAVNGFSSSGKEQQSATSSSSSSAKPKKQAPPTPKKDSDLARLANASESEKSKIVSSEIAALTRYANDLAIIQKSFESELQNAETSIAQCFKEIREAAALREQQLVQAMAQVRTEGSKFIAARRSEVDRLQNLGNGNANVQGLSHELQAFLANKERDSELAQTTRFVYDNAKLVRSIAQFGEVVAVNGVVVQPPPAPVAQSSPSQSVMKHATSHSSLVSSVGEDSGVGQVSPVFNDKPMAQIETGGIVMQSNGLSADQLAEIQRQLEEQLKAQGIDTSVLSGNGGAGTVSRRRPPPKENGAKKGAPKKNGAQRIELASN